MPALLIVASVAALALIAMAVTLVTVRGEIAGLREEIADTRLEASVALENGLNVTLPSGAVVAFSEQVAYQSVDGCPLGWELFEEAGGRTIVGAGPHDNKDQNGQPISVYAKPKTGGEEKHKLTEPEMPRHRHETRLGRSDYVQHRSGRPALDEESRDHLLTTGVSGGGRAHNNMPPYVALTYCIRQAAVMPPAR